MLSPYGTREWMMASVLCSLGAASAIIFVQWFWLAGVIGLVWLGVLLFFRDPPRRIPRNLAPGDMLSPADGRISAIEHVNDHPATNGPAVIVRIFLSILNVHINRAPFDGEVVDLKYAPGRFVNATRAEAAGVNESNLITMKVDSGGGIDETIGVRQVAGMIARRIVCPLRVGKRVQRGQRFGMIKFGSTTELILPRPDEVTVHVTRGDRVKAGVTTIATIAPL